jgi:hypothetical protein
MTAHSVRDRFDQSGSLAVLPALDRPARRRNDRKEIVAVDADAGDAVAACFFGKGARCRLPFDRHADGPAVVATEKDDRQVEDAGEVQTTVEIGGARRAIAEIDERRPRPFSGSSLPRRGRRRG